MNKDFLGKRLMLITAHPDDETYLASGTIAANLDKGGEAMLVCATLGEKGKSHLPKSMTASELKDLRKKEITAVTKLLQVKKLALLDLKDGQLCNCGNILLKKLADLTRKYKPEVIISFGADGVTGHLDHIAIGEAAEQIAVKLNIQFVSFVAPPAFIKQTDKIKARRKHGVYKDDLIYQKHNIKIKINPELKQKALLLHTSQISNQDPFYNMPAQVKREMLTYEYFFVKYKSRFSMI